MDRAGELVRAANTVCRTARWGMLVHEPPATKKIMPITNRPRVPSLRSLAGIEFQSLDPTALDDFRVRTIERRARSWRREGTNPKPLIHKAVNTLDRAGGRGQTEIAMRLPSK